MTKLMDRKRCLIFVPCLLSLHLTLVIYSPDYSQWMNYHYKFLRTQLFDDPTEQTDEHIPERCICEFESKNYSMCYSPPFNRSLIGQRFNCWYLKFLKEVDLLEPINLIDLTYDDFPDPPPIVTGASDDHKDESIEMISHVRRFWPKHPIIFYDFGLKPSTIKDFKKICNLEVRTFPFEKFPPYVKNMLEYRWKPLAMASEYLLMNGNYHGIYSTTNFGTYDFLPTDKERLKEVTELQAGFALIARTKDAMDTLKWYVLCALEKECMAPKNSSIKCKFGKDMYHAEPTCHRFDQSIINLILTNKYNFTTSYYFSQYTSAFAVRRSATEKIDLTNLTNCER